MRLVLTDQVRLVMLIGLRKHNPMDHHRQAPAAIMHSGFQ